MMPLLIPFITGGEIAFWLCAPVMVAAAIGMVITRKPVYSALLLAVVMLGLAIQYAALDAPFLFAVQIIVYTGAILMLFLFVMMIVGVDSLESAKETIKGQRIMATLAVLGLAGIVGVALVKAVVGEPAGLEAANAAGGDNVDSIALLLFSRYVMHFELTSALLMTAALAAMVLAHKERLTPKPTQPEMQRERILAYAAGGAHPGARPNSGVYATTNRADVPALLPDGTPSVDSVPEHVVGRAPAVDAAALKAAAVHHHDEIAEVRDPSQLSSRDERKEIES